MKVFNKVFGRLRRTSGKKLVMTAALFGAMTVAGFAGVSSYTNSKVEATSDCTQNSIVHCGAPGAGINGRRALVNDINANPELKNIYASAPFNFKPADYNRFITAGVAGVAYSHSSYGDNVIVVGGRVVATNVGSIGREASFQGSGYRVFTIAGKNYYGNLNTKAFAANTSAIPVDVLFDATGKMQFAVMTNTCGNPAYGSPVQPTYACHNLIATRVGSADANSWHFTTNANAANGAKITKLVYNFGDGTPTAVTSTPSAAVPHTFTKASKVTVSVYVSVPGGGTVILSNCVYQVPFTPPPAVFACDKLTATPGNIDQQGRQLYALTARAHATNATIKSYNFAFGDGKTAIVSTGAITATTTNLYTPATTNYQATVTVTVLTNTGKTVTTAVNTNCSAPVSVKPLVTSLTCDSLTANKGSVDATSGVTSYTFTAQATPKNATISSYAFNFGDSTQTKVTSATSTTSDAHTFAPGPHTVSVTVSGQDVNGKSLTNTNANCMVTFNVPTPSAPGVTITKHVDNLKTEQVAVGQVFSYELVVTNTGNVDLTNAAVIDTPPVGVTLLTADKGTISNNTWNYTIPSLKVGASASFNLTAKVPAQVDGSLVNTACVNAVEVNPTQPNQTDACDTATVTVPPVVPKNPNITITKTVDGQKSEQVAVGQNFVYQLVIKNTGEKDLVNAVVTDTAPAGVTLLSADLGTVTGDTAWTYTIPSLAVGDSVTVKLTAEVKTYIAGSLVNTACVNAPEVNPEQPDQTDACDTATVTVTPPATPPATPPTSLVNTGAGSVLGLFGAAAIVGMIAHRLFLGRRLSRQQ